MSVFKVTNIIKITSLVDFDATFRPYRQNFIYTLAGREVLEMRVGEPEKALYYYKAVLPYANVEMIEEFDAEGFPITYNLENLSGGGLNPQEIKVGQELEMTFSSNEDYYCPLQEDLNTEFLSISQNCEITRYEMMNNAFRIFVRRNEEGDVQVTCKAHPWNFVLGIPTDSDGSVRGKVASSLQSDISESDNTISGTLNYVKDWLEFSDDPTYQAGHYIMLKPTANAGVSSISTSDIQAPIVQEGDLYVCYIDSTHAEIDVEFQITPESGSGYQFISKRYSCEGLTLSPDVGGLTPFESGDGVTNIAFDVNMDTTELETMISDAVTTYGTEGVVDLMEVTVVTNGGSMEWGLIQAKPGQMWFASNTAQEVIYDGGTWQSFNIPEFGTFNATTGIANITHSLMATATFNSAISGFNGVVFGKI